MRNGAAGSNRQHRGRKLGMSNLTSLTSASKAPVCPTNSRRQRVRRAARMNAAPNLSPTTFAGFYALGYTGLAPIVPYNAEISEKSSLALRVGTDQDSRGKA